MENDTKSKVKYENKYFSTTFLEFIFSRRETKEICFNAFSNTQTYKTKDMLSNKARKKIELERKKRIQRKRIKGWN